MQKSAPVEEQIPRQFPAADDSVKIIGMIVFRARFEDRRSALHDVLVRFFIGVRLRAQLEPAATFPCIALQGLVHGLLESIEAGSGMLCQQLFVEISDFIAAGIVQSGHKTGAVRNIDTAFAQDGAYRFMISHPGKGAGIRRARFAGTCAAIVSGEVGIINAAGAVGNDNHQGRKVLRQTDIAQQAAQAVRHFRKGKSQQVTVFGRFLGFPSRCSWECDSTSLKVLMPGNFEPGRKTFQAIRAA